MGTKRREQEPRRHFSSSSRSSYHGDYYDRQGSSRYEDQYYHSNSRHSAERHYSASSRHGDGRRYGISRYRSRHSSSRDGGHYIQRHRRESDDRSNREDEKRRAGDVEDGIRRRSPKILSIKQRHEDLTECFGGRAEGILWDTATRLRLVWPSLKSLEKLYFYIGRQQAEMLFADVLKLGSGNCMQILGAKGSGKSTVMAAIAGYLHGTGMKRVVYLSGYHFVAAPFPVLQEALLLCWSGQDAAVQELWDIQDMKGLQDWCDWRDLYFVVDDWDKVEMKPTAKADLELACEGNMLIRISSVNSRERVAYDASDKAGDYIRTSHFDGPFTKSELQTWIAHSGLPVENLNSLDYYTGGMPGLARFYSESSNAEAYRENIARQVTSRVQKEIVAHLTNKDRVVAALRLVTSHDGLVLPLALDGMKLACFYKEGNRYHILCPYLRTVAEEAIVSEGSSLEKRLHLSDIQTWISAVQADLRALPAARNPARIGWNVEGLIIGVLRVQGELLRNYPFAVYRTYAHGKEIDALSDLNEDDLRAGVLLGPVAFNEKAVDIVYLILRCGVIELIAVQITIASWKAREKSSHVTWEKEVLPKWTAGLTHQVQQTFLYAMPQNVQLVDVPKLQCKAFSELSPRLSFLNALSLEEPEVGLNLTRSPLAATVQRRTYNAQPRDLKL